MLQDRITGATRSSGDHTQDLVVTSRDFGVQCQVYSSCSHRADNQFKTVAVREYDTIAIVEECEPTAEAQGRTTPQIIDQSHKKEAEGSGERGGEGPGIRTSKRVPQRDRGACLNSSPRSADSPQRVIGCSDHVCRRRGHIRSPAYSPPPSPSLHPHLCSERNRPVQQTHIDYMPCPMVGDQCRERIPDVNTSLWTYMSL